MGCWRAANGGARMHSEVCTGRPTQSMLPRLCFAGPPAVSAGSPAASMTVTIRVPFSSQGVPSTTQVPGAAAFKTALRKAFVEALSSIASQQTIGPEGSTAPLITSTPAWTFDTSSTPQTVTSVIEYPVEWLQAATFLAANPQLLYSSSLQNGSALQSVYGAAAGISVAVSGTSGGQLSPPTPPPPPSPLPSSHSPPPRMSPPPAPASPRPSNASSNTTRLVISTTM